MRNITFSADETDIEAARARAAACGTTLNDAFRNWLASYAAPGDPVQRAMDTIARMQTYVRTGGRKFTRDEMNER